MEEEQHLIIVTHGIDDGIRQMLFALQYGMTLINMGLNVTIFLTGLAVRWSYKELSSLRGKGEIVTAMDYFTMFIKAGGRVKVCTTCYEDEMMESYKESEIASTVIKGAELVGLAEVVEDSLDRRVTVF